MNSEVVTSFNAAANLSVIFGDDGGPRHARLHQRVPGDLRAQTALERLGIDALLRQRLTELARGKLHLLGDAVKGVVDISIAYQEAALLRLVELDRFVDQFIGGHFGAAFFVGDLLEPSPLADIVAGDRHAVGDDLDDRLRDRWAGRHAVEARQRDKQQEES
jgi:hypothetical protein